jgi:hypothetical protein
LNELQNAADKTEIEETKTLLLQVISHVASVVSHA